MFITTFYFVAGLVALIGGAELLVRAASRLATSMGISKLVVGLTVIAFGTSAPELAVSIQSGISGQTDIMTGNIIGSNITNTLLILGLSALIIPLKVHKSLIKIDLPFMIAITVLVYVLGLNGWFGFWECLLLALLLAGYLIFLFRQKEGVELTIEPEKKEEPPSLIKNLFLLVFGFAGLILGANWVVDSAVVFAEMAGISQLTIGLTVVAIGTSLPEIVISLLAAFKGERDIAVGNIIGSNILNFLAVLGVSGLFIPQAIPISSKLLHVDLLFLIGISLLCFPVFFTGRKIVRHEGAVFLVLYFSYIGYQVMTAAEYVYTGQFISVVVYLIFPMVILLVLGSLYFEIKKRYRFRNFNHVNYRSKEKNNQN